MAPEAGAEPIGATEILLGAVADDHTGATDLAGMLAAQGVRVVQILGLRPEAEARALARAYQAVVIALKSRAQPVAQARADSLEALRQLQAMGARQIYFKYCSTFDSTRAGNIGPVTDALLTALGAPFTIAVPALPVNGRRQYLGHLFVGDELLSESPLASHPVNPMTDSNLVRHLQAQTRRRTGLVAFDVVRRGAPAVRAEMARLERDGVEIALVDALADEDLATIAQAAVDLPLVTGGSGLAMKLPALWAERGLHVAGAPSARRPRDRGKVLIVAGSCSARTLDQIRVYETRRLPEVTIDVAALFGTGAPAEIERVGGAVDRALAGSPAALAHTSMGEHERSHVLAAAESAGLSPERARAAIESATAAIARAAVGRGIRRLVVAGGETSGAVVEALGIGALEIGEMLAPGVPHCRAPDSGIELVLKSGNFGGPDFFLKAIDFLGGTDT